MAPKRSAAPPSPPPPVASSEETASVSGSEEEEEEIAHSPPPAAPKSIAPPPQRDQEPEASDEDEDSEAEEDDEEEEDEKANHVIPSSANKNPPPPPPTREESETSDEEEEEEADDEMPQTKPAPNQEMEAKGAKRRNAKDAKRRNALFQRTWSTDDEFRILEVLAAHRLEHGTLPQPDVLANALAGKLDNSGCGLSELKRKVKSLQNRYIKAVKKGAPPSKDEDRRLFDLFKNVWPSTKVSATKPAATKVAATKAAANSGAGREPDEMCKLYSYLAEEVRALQKAHPGLFKREFAMIDDSKARAMDEKIKRQRFAQMRLYLRRHDLTKEVTKTLMDLAE